MLQHGYDKSFSCFSKKIFQNISLSKHVVTFGTLLWSPPKWFLWSIHSISNNLGLDIQSNKLDFILPKYYFCQVWLDLAWFWIERMKCKKVYDNDIQRTNKQWSSFFNYTFERGKLKPTPILKFATLNDEFRPSWV